MIRWRTRFGLMSIVLGVMLSSCQTPATPSPVLSLKPTEQVSILVSPNAPAQIKREGWKDYQPTGFGTLVYSTDLLKTNGPVMLLCSDIQTVRTLTGLGSNPCPLVQNAESLTYDDMWLESGTRTPIPDSVPYILYPRSTSILEPRPILRWHNTGAISYTVEIRQGASLHWRQIEATSDTLAYPANAPELVAGKDYLLVITDNTSGRDSTEDPNKGLGFQVVDASQRVDLENRQQALSNLSDLDPAAQKLALALLYDQVQISGRGLWGEASALLHEVATAQPNAPAVQLRLGDTLGKIKLWGEAEVAYEAAFTMAQTLSQLENQAEALAALWRITGNQAQFDQAVRLYEQLGATSHADKLRNEQGP